jgi:hypothetical protein
MLLSVFAPHAFHQRFVQAINTKEPLKIMHYKVWYASLWFEACNNPNHPTRPWLFEKHYFFAQGKAKDVGHLVFDGSTAMSIPRFIDFLSGGLEMRMFVAVDFTASNGMPGDPRSLHHMRPGHFNECYRPKRMFCSYLQALITLAQVPAGHSHHRRYSAELRFKQAVCSVWFRRTDT